MKWIQELGKQEVRQRLRYLYVIVLLLLVIATIGSNVTVRENKEYTDFDHVALYILTYNDVPDNYVPKILSSEYDNPSKYGVFLNIEGRLPLDDTYTEAYINGTPEDFGMERFVFSDDGELYYTLNHYESFSEITESQILGGFYLFQGILYTFIVGGIVSIILVVVLHKEVTVHHLKEDLLLDYNRTKKKLLLVSKRIKEYNRKRKLKQISKKEV